MTDAIQVRTETWVETQPQEVHGFAWACSECHAESREYSFDAVEWESARHLRDTHGVYAAWDDYR